MGGLNGKMVLAGLACGFLLAAGCNETGVAPKKTTTTTPVAASIPGGVKAAKIIFRASNSGYGSFDIPAGTGGTSPSPGSGHQAVRVFNPDGSLIASGGTSSSAWPKWLTSFEIGISGAANTSAINANCARFAATNENTTLCNFSDGDTFPCGAPDGYYRVSEFDCSLNPPTAGKGGPADGIYIRATFSRDTAYLGSTENLMAVLEYAASTLKAAPANPTSCVAGGVFDPTHPDCSDMSWQIFLKHGTSEIPQPFLLLVPPAFASVDDTNKRAGSGVNTRQFVIPLAMDSGLNTVQISRIKALANTAAGFADHCQGTAGQPGNSPLCLGMVLYSLTFYRI